jgi:segregation and condensation protein A
MVSQNSIRGESPESGGVSTAHHFKVHEFEGPLDLLLFLIKKNEVNIYDIPIAEITRQYMEYLSYTAAFDMDALTEFHLMAATLLYIKSRMLLPVELADDDEIEDPRQELVEKLIEYQRFRKLSLLMEEKEKEAEWVIERKKLQRVLPFTDDDLWEKADVWELLKTFSRLTANITGERVVDLYEEVSINEKLTLMMELIETRGACAFTDLVTRHGSIMDIVCAFLAVLEAVKTRVVSIYQHRMFGDIVIRGNDLCGEGVERETDGATVG